MGVETVSNPPTTADLSRASGNLQAIERFVNEEEAGDVALPGGGTTPNIPKIVVDANARIDEALGDFVSAKDQVVDLAEDVALDAAEVAASVSVAEAARDSALNSRGIFASTAAALSNGVLSTSGLTAGSGGTNGTFDVGFSGGGGSGAAARFVVAGGALTQILMLAPGKDYTSAPTMSFAASSGLTGAAATAVIGPNTANGQYFQVLMAGETEVYGVYKNNGGVAEDTGKRMVDAGAFLMAEQKQQKLALVVDELGNVPLWLTDGKLGAGGLDAILMAFLKANLNGLLEETPEGWPPFIIYSEDDEKVVLVVTRDGQVKYFGEAPNVDAGGGGPAAELPPQGASQGLSLFRWRAKLAKILQGGSGTARMVFFGDSWSERTEIVQQVADGLYERYGEAGPGWISVDSDRIVPANALNGITFAKAGSFAISDTNPTNSQSMDSFYLQDASNTGTVAIGNLKAEVIKIFYHNGDGTFRYRVDGGAWNTVAGSNSGARSTITISGLSDTPHTLDIDTTPNTGTVRLYGFHGSRTEAGVEVNKCGRGGATAAEVDSVMGLQAAYLVDFPPDVVVIILGTNDSGEGVSKATYKGHVYSIINKCKAIAPDACYLLVAAPRNGNDTVTELSEYRDAIVELATDEARVEYLNLHDLVAAFSTMNASDLDIWTDTGHLNADGGRLVFSELHKRLLGAN